MRLGRVLEMVSPEDKKKGAKAADNNIDALLEQVEETKKDMPPPPEAEPKPKHKPKKKKKPPKKKVDDNIQLYQEGLNQPINKQYLEIYPLLKKILFHLSL